MIAVISPVPGFSVAAVGIGLVAVEEGEPPAADGLLEAPDLSQEKRMPRHQGRLADERRQGAVVVAHDIDRPHLVQSREQVQVRHDGPAHVGLPEVEQVAQDIELAALGLHVVQELVEAGLAALHREIVAVAAVAQVQVAYAKDGHGFLSRIEAVAAGLGPATSGLTDRRSTD